MSRVTRESVNIRIAQIIAERGTCNRLRVGAVITIDNMIVSTGYNGTAPDEPHCTPEVCNDEKPCKATLHAETNAISKLNWRMLGKAGEKIIYVTHQPCINCAKKVREAFITTVYYIHPYRDNAGLEYLLNNNIKVIQLNEQGNPKSL